MFALMTRPVVVTCMWSEVFYLVLSSHADLGYRTT